MIDANSSFVPFVKFVDALIYLYFMMPSKIVQFCNICKLSWGSVLEYHFAHEVVRLVVVAVIYAASPECNCDYIFYPAMGTGRNLQGVSSVS